MMKDLKKYLEDIPDRYAVMVHIDGYGITDMPSLIALLQKKGIN